MKEQRNLTPGYLNRFAHLVVFCGPTLLVALAAYYMGSIELKATMAEIQSHEMLNAGRGAATMTGIIDDISRDLHYLASNTALKEALDDTNPENIARVASDMINFSNAKQIYDQLRWIDETGMERVRVDLLAGKAVNVVGDKLQNKGKRYFFADSFKLTPGEIYISPLDLNIEQNAVEVPYKPMIRLATPVTDTLGVKRGIVIINYYASVMLRTFGEATKEINDHAMVLNREGFWLKSPVPEDEWGFMLDKPTLNLTQRFPLAWAQISTSESGQIRLADGLWTWQTVYPLMAGAKSSVGSAKAFEPSRSEIESHQYVWKSVAHLSTGRLDEITNRIWWRVSVAALFVIAILTFLSSRCLNAWRARIQAESEIRSIIDNTPELLCVLDQAGKIETVNRAWQEFRTDNFGESLKTDTHDIGTGYLVIFETSMRIDADELSRLSGGLRGVLDGTLSRFEMDYDCGSKDKKLSFQVRVTRFQGEGGKVLVTHQNITERKTAERELERLSRTDPLTGLANRRHFMQLVEQELNRTFRYGGDLAVLMLDVDHFKTINDTYGHQVGDQVLKKLSVVYDATLREVDVVGRIGGEEFAILLPQTDKSQAVVVAERLRQTIAETAVPLGDGVPLHFHVSIGVSVASVGMDQRLTIDNLLAQADRAMYAAKNGGRNRVCVQPN